MGGLKWPAEWGKVLTLEFSQSAQSDKLFSFSIILFRLKGIEYWNFVLKEYSLKRI